MRIADRPAMEAAHPFVRTTEVLGDQHGPLPASQSGPDLGGTCLRSGQHRDRPMCPADVERPAQGPSVCRYDRGVIPGPAQQRERPRNGGTSGQHYGSQASGKQQPHDAEETRIAAGQHHGRGSAGQLVQLGWGEYLSYCRHRHGGKLMRCADHDLGLSQRLSRAGRQRPTV
jgi:hypothetical protein